MACEPVTGAVLFIDAVDSVTISKVFGPRRYVPEFLMPLQKCYRHLLYLHGIARSTSLERTALSPRRLQPQWTLHQDVWYTIQGDELCVVVVRPEQELRSVLDRLIHLALETKLVWWQWAPNDATSRYAMRVFDLGMGIHVGPVVVQPRPWKREEKGASGRLDVEGVALNYAKRIEGVSRHGRCSGLMVSEDVWKALDGSRNRRICFDRPRFETPRGTESMSVYEVVAHRPVDVILTPGKLPALVNILYKRAFDVAAYMVMKSKLQQGAEELQAKELQRAVRQYAEANDTLKAWLKRNRLRI